MAHEIKRWENKEDGLLAVVTEPEKGRYCLTCIDTDADEIYAVYFGGNAEVLIKRGYEFATGELADGETKVWVTI